MSVHSHARDLPAGLRDGFSLIELIVVIVLIVALSGIAFGRFHQGAAERGAISARDTYIWLGRRARAAAVQRGNIVRMTLNPATGQGRLWLGKTGATAVTDGLVTFGKEFNVTVTTSTGDSLIVCYSPRGYALSGSCSTSALPATVTFTRGPAAVTATVQVLGQVEANS